MLPRASERIGVVRRHYRKLTAGSSVSALGLIGAFLAWQSGVDRSTVKWVAWVSASVFILSFFPAQYGAWKEEREAREKAEAELKRAADMRGDIWIEVLDTNPLADQTIVASRLRYNCDCVNHGSESCEITKVWIEITTANHLWFGIPHDVPARTIQHARIFRHGGDVTVRGVSPSDLRRAAIKVSLIDSLDNRHSGTITKISPRTLRYEASSPA